MKVAGTGEINVRERRKPPVSAFPRVPARLAGGII